MKIPELWTYFTPYSSVSVVDFEQVNVNWSIRSVIPVFLG